MNKSFKLYSLIWILFLGLFNLITFIIPESPEVQKYTASFWIGYSFVSAAFIGQLACSWASFRSSDAKKMFYSLPMLGTSYGGLILTLAVSVICMAVPAIPYWIAAIICSVILVINAVLFLRAKLSVDYVTGIDEKIENGTSFVYGMRQESESLLALAGSADARLVAKKVRDAFKYSDPMSAESLSDIEAEITESFELLSTAIKEERPDEINAEAEKLLALIAARSNKCKAFK